MLAYRLPAAGAMVLLGDCVMRQARNLRLLNRHGCRRLARIATMVRSHAVPDTRRPK